MDLKHNQIAVGFQIQINNLLKLKMVEPRQIMKIEGLDDIDEDVFKHDSSGVDAIKQDPLNNTIYRMETDPVSADRD